MWFIILLILLLTFVQLCVIKKFSSISSTMRMNLFIGTEKLSVFFGTYGRAETLNIPSMPRGWSLLISRYGYRTIEPQPALKGAITASRSTSSKPVRVKRPDKISGRAKNMTTSGSSICSSLSHRLNTICLPGASKRGEFLKEEKVFDALEWTRRMRDVNTRCYV